MRCVLSREYVKSGDEGCTLSASILNVTFDCSDAASTARFWSEVTTWPCAKEEMPGNPYWVVGPSA
jgi:hypothetical protein